MSRSGYSDDCDGWDLIRWRGAVNSALRGTRGQQLLREMAAALDAMPEKKLIEGVLETSEGEHCALGVVGMARGMDMHDIDPEDRKQVAAAFNIAAALAAEIAFINDDGSLWQPATPQERWIRVRTWVENNLKA